MFVSNYGQNNDFKSPPPTDSILANALYRSCLPSNLGVPLTPDSGLRVEPNGLYILLWDTGFTNKYHWALLLAQSETTGVIFHQTTVFCDKDNDTQGNNIGEEWQWKFVAESLEVYNSPGLLCALKVGILEDAGRQEWVDAVKQCVGAAVIPPSVSADDAGDSEEKSNEDSVVFSGRTWLLMALYELANGGFIGMVADEEKIANTVEMEARRLARDAEILGVGMVTVSEMCVD